MKLNEKLLNEQKVSTEQKNNLITLHARLRREFQIAKVLLDTDSLIPKHAKIIANEVKKIEFSMQENWNFEQDESNHKYWYRIPGCTCPIMDNDDMLGSRHRWFNDKCPYHGYKETKDET